MLFVELSPKGDDQLPVIIFIIGIEEEIKRFNKFRTGVLGYKQEKTSVDVDVRNYAKYFLKEGALIEKRELLFCLKSRLSLKDKKVVLA